MRTISKDGNSMKSLILSAATLAFAVALPAHASEDLAKKYMCTTCHVVKGAKTIGPAYADVANKACRQGQEGRAGRLGPGADAAQRQRAGRRRQDVGEVDSFDQVDRRERNESGPGDRPFFCALRYY
jgi:cytochrome c551/c552